MSSNPSTEQSSKPAAKTTVDEPVLSAPRVLQTPDDVVMAYLRGEIGEDKLREGLARYGVVGPEFFGLVDSPNRVDAGFLTKIPDDLFERPSAAHSTEEVIAQLNKEAEERDKATKEAEAKSKETAKS
jgi:hypothetical protein